MSSASNHEILRGDMMGKLGTSPELKLVAPADAQSTYPSVDQAASADTNSSSL